MAIDEYTSYGKAERKTGTCADPPNRECSGTTYYYIKAIKEDLTDDKATRGLVYDPACCDECEECCWCDSEYLLDDTADPRRDATFTSTVDGPADMELIIANVNYCGDGSPVTCDQWRYDHWAAINPNGTHIVPWSQKNESENRCEWVLVDGAFVEDGITFHYEYRIAVYYADFGAIDAGEWLVEAELFQDSSGTPDDCTGFEAPPWTFVHVNLTGADRPYCAPATWTANNEHLLYCSPTNGTVTVNWEIDAPYTPQYYDAVVETGGDTPMVPCPKCSQKAIVAEAIAMLGGDAPHDQYYPPLVGEGVDETNVWRLYQTDKCTWATPYFAIHKYPSWFLTGRLIISENGVDDGDSDWDLQFWLVDMTHGRKIFGQNDGCFCPEDMETHLIFNDTQTQADAQCDDPPNSGVFTNDIVCGDHENQGGVGGSDPLEYEDCAENGTVTITAGWV